MDKIKLAKAVGVLEVLDLLDKPEWNEEDGIRIMQLVGIDINSLELPSTFAMPLPDNRPVEDPDLELVRRKFGIHSHEFAEACEKRKSPEMREVYDD